MYEIIMCLPARKAMDCASVTDVDRSSSYHERTPELEENEQLRQVCSYALIKHNGQYLSYCRKGTEKRLHGQRSIGVGGHIEYPETVEHGMIREVREELGIVLDLNRIEWKGFIRLSDSPVDRVHMAVVYEYDLEDPSTLFFDDSEITDVQWIDEITDEYEAWSLEAWKLAKGQVA